MQNQLLTRTILNPRSREVWRDRWAALKRPGEVPRWNFHKYLVGRDGRIAAVFATQVEPTDTRVIATIEKELL